MHMYVDAYMLLANDMCSIQALTCYHCQTSNTTPNCNTTKVCSKGEVNNFVLYLLCLQNKLRLNLRNGLQRIHICIFYQNINKNFPIKMLYVLWLYFLTIEKLFYTGSNLYLL